MRYISEGNRKIKSIGGFIIVYKMDSDFLVVLWKRSLLFVVYMPSDTMDTKAIDKIDTVNTKAIR